MKLTKRILLSFSLLAGLCGAYANAVTITNISSNAIPVKYQLAYHNPHEAVLLKGVQQAIIPAQGKLNIAVDTDPHYANAGIVVVSVKPDSQKDFWFDLPEQFRQFDQTPGCWAATNDSHSVAALLMGLNYLDPATHNQAHYQLTCGDGKLTR